MENVIKCGLGIEFLPALEFHHLDSSSKNYTWRDLRGKNIDEIIQLLKTENVQVLCKNCHTLTGNTNFVKFKDMILSEKFTIDNFEQFEAFILEEIKNNPKYKEESLKGAQHRARIKYRIVKWIKKRMVIEILYAGACIGCGDIKINDKLPALEFHHRNPDKKELKWEKISKYPLNKIITLLKKEECVCLCRNCHIMTHSINFDQFVNIIFGEELTIMVKQVKKYYSILEDNIKNFPL